VAANKEAKEMGQRLFLTYCAQCHGSDAKGAKGFPNLVDSDWLFGGTPDQIKESIIKGRDAMMPAKGVKPDLNGDQIKDLAATCGPCPVCPPIRSRPARQGTVSHRLRSLPWSRRQGHARRCAEPEDKVWLYGSSEEDHHRNDHQGPQSIACRPSANSSAMPRCIC
jgi:cytochrome c oxidase cbb3-type subunit 3